MPRRYALAHLIDLPRLDARATVTFVTAVLAVAADEAGRHRLPAALERARKRIEAALAKLQAVLQDRLHAAAPPDTRQADHDEDSAWASLYGFLTAWMRLPGAPEAARAAAARQVLFPDALRFVNFAYQHEWEEAERRLGRIHADKLDQTIAALGGQRILDVLTSVHAAYGQTLGYTQAQAAGDTPLVAAPLTELRDELRRYVLQALAAVDPDEPATHDLAERLLKPIDTWRSPTATTKPTEPTPAKVE